MAQKAIYASAARTSTPTALTFSTSPARALVLVVDVTAKTSTPSVTVTIDGYDSSTGKTFNLLTSAAFDGTTETRTLQVGPEITAATNLAANKYLPDIVKVTATHGNANSITYSISAHLI